MNNSYGWMGNIVRINLSTGEIQTQTIADIAERFIGGRGFISREIYWDVVDAKTDALHPDSPLLFMTGPLAGTGAIAGSRWFIAGKSPLLFLGSLDWAALGAVLG